VWPVRGGHLCRAGKLQKLRSAGGSTGPGNFNVGLLVNTVKDRNSVCQRGGNRLRRRAYLIVSIWNHLPLSH